MIALTNERSGLVLAIHLPNANAPARSINGKTASPIGVAGPVGVGGPTLLGPLAFAGSTVMDIVAVPS